VNVLMNENGSAQSNLCNVRIGLVFPSYKEGGDAVSVPENKKHLGAIPPLSLAYVAAILERHKCIVKIIDASASELSKQQVVDELRSFNPDFIGFTSCTLDFFYTLQWINYIKTHLSVPLIIGGVHLLVYPQETLIHKNIDYAVIGEAEETLPELLCCLRSGSDLRSVKGIGYRDKDEIVITEKRNHVRDLNQCPFPARHLLSNDSYYSFISKKKKFTAMLTSRGCPFHCIFCDNQSIPYRCRNAQSVVDEMEECQKKYGIEEIDIFDALFSIDPVRVIEICKEIRKRKLTVIWSFRTRVDLVSEEMLDELSRSGCIRIYYGIESGDETILKNIHKCIDVATVKNVVTMTKRKGLEVLGYFMIGNIGETEETIKKTLDLMLELPLDYVQISSVFAPPNTGLYQQIKSVSHVDYWHEYTINPDNTKPLPRYRTDLSPERIEWHIYMCYLKFYLRFSYIIQFVIKLRSLHQLLRSYRALKDVITSFYALKKKNRSR
jgi:anaerobic magnesium-protoporphyrin IX monomethyl ester cyclase